MEEHRFRELVAAWGADPARWPADERALHARFAGSPEGRELLAEAARLDAALDALLDPPADPLRAARILRRAREQRVANQRTLRVAMAACAASAVLGFTLGFSSPSAEEATGDYSGMLIGRAAIEEYL